MTRQEIENLAYRDPLIHAAIWRMYAPSPSVTFASETDKWANVLQDLVAQMHARHAITEGNLIKYVQRYGSRLLTEVAGGEEVEMIPLD